MKKILFTIALTSFLFTSCKKDTAIISNLTVNFSNTIDETTLLGDTIQYTNSSNQDYSVITLKYLISDITLTNSDGVETLLKEVHYFDLSNSASFNFLIENLAYDNYTSISFTMGLDTNQNKTNLYVDEDFHASMFWPDFMGGGYHYMKLEGAFNNDSTFYNTHTGGTMGMDFSFNKKFDISLISNSSNQNADLNINMEINNWYNSPNAIELTTDGIMGNKAKQMQLKENGNLDVFSVSIK